MGLDYTAMNWSAVHNYRFTFKNIINSDLENIVHIHPLKQRVVDLLYQQLSKLTEVDAVYVFGSAADIRCTINSDIDVAIRLQSDSRDIRSTVSEMVQEICEWDADVIWINDLSQDENLYQDIMGGVQIV